MTLFVAEDYLGIYGGGSAGGDPAGEESYDGEEDGDCGEGDDVVGAYSVEEAGGKFCEGEGGGQADGYGDQSETHALSDEEGFDCVELCSEGDADADLVGAASD